jgi:restriction system protein
MRIEDIKMARKEQGLIEGASYLVSILPWWAGVTCALISFLVLRWYAALQILSTPAVNNIDIIAAGVPFHRFTIFGQYLLPGLFLTAALLSATKNSKRRNLYYKISRSVTQESLNNLSWRDFEFLVGEYFRRRGFSVEKTKTNIDLIARKDREKYVIQCQQWKICEIGVKIVRELSEVVAGDEATGGIVVTSGEFTKDAIISAKANNILLLGGRELHAKIKLDVKVETQSERQTGKGLRKAKWTLGFLLIFAICFSALHLGEINTSFHSTLSDQIKRLHTNNQEHHITEDGQMRKQINRAESTDIKFTDIQIKQAMEDVVNKKRRQQFEIGATDSEEEDGNSIYEIELFSGGWIYTDNAKITEKKITYRSANGIVVSIDRTAVKTMQKRKIAD